MKLVLAISHTQHLLILFKETLFIGGLMDCAVLILFYPFDLMYVVVVIEVEVAILLLVFF